MSSKLALALALIAAGVGCALAAPSGAAGAGAPASQPLAVVLGDHVARKAPSADAGRIEAVQARRPLTGTRTVLPVLGQARSRSGGTWLRVRLPGRPNGHAGWIAAERTKLTSTPWHVAIDLSSRWLTVFRGGLARRHFRAVVGTPSTPTPRGVYFVEEGLALASYEPGGPFALATSARSNVFQEFAGGPGQIGIHGTDNLSGAPGTAASHGCVRLRTRAITWIARRIGAGVPLTIRR
ncbi:MAG TPA: L,D-transpeptidase [Solirubrobacterales bacterium]|nr:L,D-transpeptidase [Solirubrobacterales bacterium]